MKQKHFIIVLVFFLTRRFLQEQSSQYNLKDYVTTVIFVYSFFLNYYSCCRLCYLSTFCSALKFFLFFCPFLKQPLFYQVRARIDHAHFCVSISHSNCPPVLCLTPIHHTHLNDIIPSANVNLTPDPFCLFPSVLLKIAADNGVTNITLKQRFLD